MQACEEATDHADGSIVIFDGLQSAVSLEAFEQHPSAVGITVQQADDAGSLPTGEADDRSRGLGARDLQLQRRGRSIGTAHRNEDPGLSRSDRAFRAELPPLQQVQRDG